MRKFTLLAALLAMAMVLMAALPAIAQVTQEDEQEGESADINQDFSVTSEGDNSTQCAGIQGASNTGNSQNVIDLLQYEGETDDFEFEEVGSSLDVSPTNTTECTSEVNQAASASG
jgi:competence protein ComGF